MTTVHNPIYINGNSEFISANGVTGGSGTSGDPYIIENWDIDASTVYGIDIINTDVYFIIRNCVIHDGYEPHIRWNDGIYFYSVLNGKIDNVISYNNYHGILLYYSSNNNTITNCNVYNNKYYGIWMGHSSNNNQISNCNIYNNSYGIFLSSSSNNNHITDCVVYNNSRTGIYLYDSSDTQIHYNNIYNNTEYGVKNSNSESQYVVDATYCWWGSGGTGANMGKPGEEGNNPVSSNVLYEHR